MSPRHGERPAVDGGRGGVSRAEAYGDLTLRLAFGAGEDPRWAEVRKRHAIKRGGSLATTRKNCADMELAITAMDLLHDSALTGFVIVSKDGDFASLAMRLREEGKLVIGIGNGGASAALVRAFHQYENVGAWRMSASGPKNESPVAEIPGTTRLPPRVLEAMAAHPSAARHEFLDLAKRAATLVRQRDGWIRVAPLGGRLRNFKPEIRYADYGPYPD